MPGAPSIRPTIRVTGANSHACPRDGQRVLEPLGVPAARRAEDGDAQALAHRPAGARMWAQDGPPMRTLLIDNYDSYTFNLFHLLGEVNGEAPVVVRNDELPWDRLAALDVDNIVISPGPGRPEHARDVGASLDALRHAEVPVLGVCLGHQALAYVAGGSVEHAREVMHGRLSPIQHDESALFAGVPQGFMAVRYHSLVVGARPGGPPRHGVDPGRRRHGPRAPLQAALRRAVPPRVRRHAPRPPADRELPRPHARPAKGPGPRARRRGRGRAGAPAPPPPRCLV